MAKRKKFPPRTWELAKALFESGKSYQAVSDETGIPKVTLFEHSKKEGWQQGRIERIISVVVEATEAKQTLNPNEKNIVEDEVIRILSRKKWYQSQAAIVADKAVAQFVADPEANGSDAKLTMEALKAAQQVEGLQPFFASGNNIQTTVNANNEPERFPTLDEYSTLTAEQLQAKYGR